MKETIINYIKELEKTTDKKFIPTKLSSWIKSKSNNEIYGFLMNDPNNFGDDFLQRLFNIRNDLNTYPKCVICGNHVTKFVSYLNGYKETCSKKCTSILKYGCEHPMKSNIVMDNLKKSLIEKYGVDNAFKSNKIKEKIKQTNLEKYGVENPQQNKIIKRKTVKTNLERYNSESPLGNNDIREKIKQTNIERYNSESPLGNNDIREKIKQTNIERYGVETPMENDICKNSLKKTILKKYGVDNILKVPEINNKIKNTNIEKYGVEYPLMSKEIQNKIKQTNLKKFGNEIYSKSRTFLTISFNNFKNLIRDYVIPLFDENEYQGFQSEKLYQWQCVKCGNVFEQRLYTSSPKEFNDLTEYLPRCLKCYPHLSGTSYLEKSFLNFVKDIYDGEILENNKILIAPLELDVVIPEKKIAFEFNGTYWHSSKIKSIDYHLNKTLECEKIGYTLIHIWEYDWVNKNELIKGKVKALLGIDQIKIYARKCSIKEISSKEKNEFLNLNHIQGDDKSNVKLGLFYENELVAVMTFGKPRFNNNYDYELIRYATKLGCQVLGGAGKLLKYFEKIYKPKSIITYADRSYSQGNMYRKIGFNELKPSTPNYHWVKGDEIYTRYQCQKHNLKRILGDKFSKDLSENENMSLNCYTKIYDCGNLVFLKLFENK